MFQPHHPYEKRIHIIYKLIFMTVKVINRCKMINEYTYWKILMSYRTTSVIFFLLLLMTPDFQYLLCHFR